MHIRRSNRVGVLTAAALFAFAVSAGPALTAEGGNYPPPPPPAQKGQQKGQQGQKKKKQKEASSNSCGRNTSTPAR